ncbi:hypothetical protein [Pelagicoccus albus]|uniref:Uncharacterized protein n=1 Tax=Pelagicoccus albus TaxID=415222 RepID=A0A7X1B909_9BACT|nr:hypothetical protein [Pelagicoccus albus]MBC2606585.1 hypothetical protein [Pelagicoccus albus]
MPKQTGLRPLYLVNELAKAVGEEVTYAYDDLAFISHSEVLVQFVENSESEALLHFYVHQDFDEEVFAAKKAKYEIAASKQGTTLICQGRFTLNAKEDSDEIDLQFFPLASSEAAAANN